jgi:hypothetical protein
MSGEMCARCDHAMEVVSLEGALATWRCRFCGVEQAGVLTFGDPDRVSADMKSVALIIRWKNVPPSAAEVGALRRIFPKFAAIPLSEFMKIIGKKEEHFVVGSYLLPEANALHRRLVDGGLDPIIEE